MHTRWRVYREMLRHITRIYPGLPDPRSMDLEEIEFWYDGIRAEIMDSTKPKSNA